MNRLLLFLKGKGRSDQVPSETGVELLSIEQGGRPEL